MDDLTARIAELAALIGRQLDEDRAVAREAAGLTEQWVAEEPAIGVVLVDGEPLIEGHIAGLTAHIARHDPARVLRRVKAARELVAEIMAEGHYYDESGYYSCSQAVDVMAAAGESTEPGSGCSDRERAGKPCDCGRDAQVARRLAIIASEWEAAWCRSRT
jgi:hypothetical protein